jgi:hypothetical protein
LWLLPALLWLLLQRQSFLLPRIVRMVAQGILCLERIARLALWALWFLLRP